MSAIRLARAVTGREKLLKFAGAYHGHVDGLLAQAGSGVATQGMPGEPGRARRRDRDHDHDPVERPRRARAPPSLGTSSPPCCSRPCPPTWAWFPPAQGFWSGLAAGAAPRTATLLIADEVITGFRVARGGGQELLGLDPDLTIMGKIIGGGLPAAAYGGPARADAADRTRRRRLPGGHAVGESARGRRRVSRHSRSSTRRPTRGLPGSLSGSP